MIKMQPFSEKIEKIGDGNITNNVQWKIKKIIKYISRYIPVLIQYLYFYSFSEISTQIFWYNKKEKKRRRNRRKDFIARILIEEIYV